jgi:hypothetical protein
MGYYNQLGISQQADVDRMVVWYKSSGKYLPPYLHEWLLARDERVWSAIHAWEAQDVATKVSEAIMKSPKPASEHVALQLQTRREAADTVKASQTITLSKSDYRLIMGAVIVFATMAIGLLLWIARLI